MEYKYQQTASRQANTNMYFHTLTKYKEELNEIHRNYHPMEANKLLKVDDEYMKRFEKLFGVEVV